MAWLHRRREVADPWGVEPVDVTCVRVVLDARAAAHLSRHLPAGGDLASVLRRAAARLRELHAGWLAAGLVTRTTVPPEEARAAIARWREVPASDGQGAAVTTLLVASRGPLVTEDVARTEEEVRVALEAIGNLLVPDLLAVELTPPVPVARAGIAARIPDPPLVASLADSEQRFCGTCGLPVPGEIERCPECGAPLP